MKPRYLSRHSDYATCWATEKLGFDSRQEQEICTFSVESRPALEPTYPPTQLVPGAVPSG
jgi:hypothetical protein